MRISEERGTTGLTATPVGDDETRIPHRPRPHESFQLLGSHGHVREVSHVVVTTAPVQGRGCCACLVGIKHGPCGDCTYFPRFSVSRAHDFHPSCVASSGAAGAAGHSVTESHSCGTPRNKHLFVKRRSRVLRRRTRQAALDKPRVHDGQLGFAILEQKCQQRLRIVPSKRSNP